MTYEIGAAGTPRGLTGVAEHGPTAPPVQRSRPRRGGWATTLRVQSPPRLWYDGIATFGAFIDGPRGGQNAWIGLDAVQCCYLCLARMTCTIVCSLSPVLKLTVSLARQVRGDDISVQALGRVESFIILGSGSGDRLLMWQCLPSAPCPVHSAIAFVSFEASVKSWIADG